MDKPLIMVVEDDVNFADKIAETIKSTGKYEVVVAYSARDAFAQLKKHRQWFGIMGNRIKLILLDIKMPEMDGLQFLDQLRRKYAAEKIGVIMVTAYEDEEKWNKATEGWVAGYITKPFETKDLLAAVDRYFSNPEAYVDMTLETMERHMEKMKEFKKQKEGS